VEVNGVGVINCLEAIKQLSPKTRFLQASTSELFGDTKEERQNEDSLMNPQSPYAIGKYVGYQAVKKYREAYGLFAVNAISFNHASPRRTSDYLDRKVTLGVARIKLGLQKELRLGNLAAKRDWTFAREIAHAMLRMLAKETPSDYVLGSGKSCTVEEWVAEAFSYVGLNWKDHVVIDKRLFRPAEVDTLLADPSKAEEELGWKTEKTWQELCHLMVDADLAREKV
jgi:GDPmannose 4,6-dehydratase